MTLERRAVLKELKVEKNGILIEEIPFVEKLNLRGNAKDKNFLTDVGSIPVSYTHQTLPTILLV